MEQYTDAEEMARAHGLETGKSFRSRLRRNLEADHTRGSWRVVVGSPKHRRMQRELDEMLAAMKGR